jgi:hypothetical protein
MTAVAPAADVALRDGSTVPPTLDGIDADAVHAVLARSLAAGGGWLEPEDVDALLVRLARSAAPSPFRRSIADAQRAASHSSRRCAHAAGRTPPVSAAAASSACSAIV